MGVLAKLQYVASTLSKIFNVITSLPCSTLISSSLTIIVRRYARILLLPLLKEIHILINIIFKHVSSTYYHSRYFVFEFAFNVT